MLGHKCKTIRKIWPFEPIDSSEIYNYINKLSKEGLALKKVGHLFAYYEDQVPNKYIYEVYPFEEKDNKARNEYIIQKENEGWEFIIYCDEILIFRKINDFPFHKTDIDIQINNDIISTNKKNFTHSFWELLTLIIALIVTTKYKEVFILLLSVKISSFLYTSIRYLYINKNKTTINSDKLYTPLSPSQIRDFQFFKLIYITMSKFLFLGLFYITFFKYKAYFLSKLIISFVAFIVIAKVYLSFRESRSTYDDSFNLSTKKKFLLLTITITIITLTLSLFVIISDHTPKEDRVRDIPIATLKSNTQTHILYHDFGHWNYSYSLGISVESYRELFIPPASDITTFNLNPQNPISLSFASAPDTLEIRYWNIDEYSKIKNFDEKYKTLTLQNNNFSIPDKDAVYCIYAKWDSEHYDGFGYYLFTA